MKHLSGLLQVALLISLLLFANCIAATAQSISPDAGGVLYVNKSVSGGNNSGDSWANALPELADALLAAKQLNDATAATVKQIWVAAGTYKPLYSPEDGANFGTDQGRDNTFLLVKDVKVYGGFAGTETTLAQRNLGAGYTSILSGDFDDNDVVTGSGSSLSISGNNENAYRVVISMGNNTPETLLDGFTIQGGNAIGSNNITINAVSISNDYGGGMYYWDSKASIVNCIFTQNNASRGGGIYTGGSSLSFYILNCVFSKNMAASGGSGLYNIRRPLIVNCTFWGNRSTGGNTSAVYTGNGTFYFRNSIVYGNNGGFSQASSTVHINYSLIQGLTSTSGGNINGNTNPLFTDAANGDFTLAAGSPLIDKGSNAYVVVNKDLAGNARIRSNTVDLGAYEVQNDNTIPYVKPDGNGIVYVNKEAIGSGSSWDDALGELSDALLAAKLLNEAAPGTVKQIWAAAGTYKPLYSPEDGANFGTDQGRDNTFLLVKNVEVYGGFAGSETSRDDRDWVTHQTILSGDIDNNDAAPVINDPDTEIIGNNSYTVVNGSGVDHTAVLDGFMITAGCADAATGAWNAPSRSGGGIYNNLGSPTLTNIVIIGNTAQNVGGGIFNSNSSPVLSNTTVSHNLAREGGGMYNTSNSSPDLTDVTISGNNADYGSGMYNAGNSSPILTNVTINENTAVNGGGGIYNNADSSPILTNVTISKNTAGYGGGINSYNNSSPILTNVIISGNTASYDGGGMYNTSSSFSMLTNVIISGNTASRDGGGMYNNNSSSPVLTNVILSGNSALDYGGGMYNINNSSPVLTNSIIWGNKKTAGLTIDNVFNASGAAVSYTYSLVEGSGGSGSWNTAFGTDGGHNLDADPLFTDAGNGDYTLGNGSPAIDAGDNSLYTGLDMDTKDLAGNPRVFNYAGGGIIDMGAYEYISPPIAPDAGGVLYVNKSVSGGNNSGDSWANALPELADALLAAKRLNVATAATVKQIWVAGGTYKPMYSPEDGTNFGTDQGRDNTFLLVKDVAVYGGFAGTETALAERDLENTAHRSTLSGDFNNDDVITGSGSTLSITGNGENAHHVVVSAGDVGTAVLDGFTITGGNADGTGTLTINGKTVRKFSGGGMYNHYSSPALTNVTLSGNRAVNDGAGMFNHSTSSPVLTNVTLSGNSGVAGGGMYNIDTSSPVLTNVTLSGNSAVAGGGMYNINASSPILTNVILSGNSAASSGGGMVNGNASSPILMNVTLSENSAANNGGGMYNHYSSPVLTNVTLGGNSAASGGGMYNYNSSPVLTNSIIWGNKKADGTTIDNVYNTSGGTPSYSYSLVEGSGGSRSWNADFGTDGGHNLDADPLFTDAANGDYTLGNGSPAIDAGNNILYTGLDADTKDLAGNSRVYQLADGGSIDLGAYESFYARPVLTLSAGATAFVEGDNVVSIPVIIDDGITVRDVDNTTLAGARVSITDNLASGEDVLAFINDGSGMGNITGSYDSSTGVLQLTSAGASATLGEWEAALRAITYTNTSKNPTTANRTISFTVNDGTVSSKAVSKTVSVDAVNDSPVNTFPAAASVNMNTDLVFNTANSNSISVSDADAGGSPVKVSLTAGKGVITLSGTSGLTFTTGDGAGDAAMIFTGTLADINSALNDLVFTPDAGYAGPAFLKITADDQGAAGSGGAKTAENTIVITVNNVAPKVLNVSSTFPDGTYKMGDIISVKIKFDQKVNVNTDDGSPALLLETGSTDRNVVYSSGSGSDELLFNYTVQPGDVSTDLDYTGTSALSLNGGTIKNHYDTNALLTLPAPGTAGSLGTNNNLVIDGIAPGVPADLTAASGDKQIILNWTANAETDIKAYKVYGGTSANPVTLLQTINAPSISYTHVSLTNGTTYYYHITAVDQAGNESSSSSEVSAVPQAPQTITFAALPEKKTNDADFDAGATASSGLEVSYTSGNTSVATIIAGKIHIVGAGTAKITATQAGNAAFLAASPVSQTLHVYGKPAFTSTPVTAAGYNQPYKYVVTAGTEGSMETAISAENLPSWLNLSANTYISTALGGVESNISGVTTDKDGNMYFADFDKVTGTKIYKISADDGSVSTWGTRASGSRIYDIQVHDGYLYLARIDDGKITRLSLTDPAAGETDVLTGLTYPQYFTLYQGEIYASTQTRFIKLDVINKTYSVFLNVPSASLRGLSFDQAGNFYFVKSYPDQAVYKYDGTAMSVLIPGFAADIEVDDEGNIYVAGSGLKKYSSDLSETTTLVNSGNILSLTKNSRNEMIYSEFSGDVNISMLASLLTGTPGQANVGIHPVTLIASNDAGNTQQSFDITVTGPATLSSFPDISKTYGDEAFNLPAPLSNNSVGAFSYISSDPAIASISGNTVTIHRAGTVTLTAKQAAYDYYTESGITATLNIAKAPLTITTDNKTKFAGTANPELTISYDGFIPGEDNTVLTVQPTISTTATVSSPIADYPITVSGAAAANYDISYVQGILKVVPGAPTSVSLAAATVYENQPAGTSAGTLNSTSDDPAAVFTYSLVSGSGDADNHLFVISGDEIRTIEELNYENKSAYQVRVRSATQHGFSLDEMFTININDVNEAPTLDVIGNQTICYTTSQQEIPLSGITAGEDAGQTTTLSVNTDYAALFEGLSIDGNKLKYRIKNGASGIAQVTVTVQDNGGTANGGTDTFSRNFTLVVNPLPEVSITSDMGTEIPKGQEIRLTASGGTSYQWANAPGIISGQNSAVLIVRPAETTAYRVTVTNANGCQNIQEITIQVREDYLSLRANNIMSPNGDGVNDYLEIKNIDMYPNNTVKIFDRAGRLLYSKTGYVNDWDGTYQGSPLAEDTYYYIVDFGPDRGQIRGFVTIVR